MFMSQSKFKPAFETAYEKKQKDKKFHYFGTDAGSWKTDVDFIKVHKYFEKGDCKTFRMFFVPRSPETAYEINQGVPQDVDAQYLGAYQKDER